MRKSLLFAVLIPASLAIAYALPQSGIAASQSTSQGPAKIGPSAVWQPPQDFIAKAHAACDKSNPPNYAECFIDQMSKSGAPADAVSFTRMFYRQSDGQVGIMSDFHKVGPVDVARVIYPLRANDNYGLLLVNGDPAILDVDDLKKLDRAAMEQSAFYQAVKQRFPNSPWCKELIFGTASGGFGCVAVRRISRGTLRFGFRSVDSDLPGA